MKALVTGGAGFIGSTLVDRLLDAGHTVEVIDSFVTGSRSNLERAAAHGERLCVRELDIRSPETIDVVAASGAEVVFHLAAQADVRVSVTDTLYDAHVNVIGSLHVIEGARRGGVRKVVFASSGGTIYGAPSGDELPIDERAPQRPISPYGVAKKVVNDYLYAYRRLHGLEWTALALANVYGPRQDPHGEAGVVAIFAGLLLAGRPCTIFGDGKQTRDFVYVDDVAAAFALAGGAAGDDEILNIGTGDETSVNALYEAMAAAAGVTAPPSYAPARAGELDRNALDNRKARAVLGWAPQVPIEQGVRRVLEWFADRPSSR
ncbi:MAG: NAD-dependent epimerase/dehydratase family protein [Acidimicrobiales bacterium]